MKAIEQYAPAVLLIAIIVKDGYTFELESVDVSKVKVTLPYAWYSSLWVKH